MANEISFSLSISVNKGGAQAAGNVNGNADLSGSEMIASVQTIGTTVTTISVGGCDQQQAVYLRNMDSTNSITVGLVSATPPTSVVSIIPPGKGVLLWGLGTAALYASSVSGAADLYVVAVEN